MSGNKDGNSKIPMLKRNEYTHWKVKMLHHLEATDPDYLDRIHDGPYIPSKLVPQIMVDGKIVEDHLLINQRLSGLRRTRRMYSRKLKSKTASLTVWTPFLQTVLYLVKLKKICGQNLSAL